MCEEAPKLRQILAGLEHAQKEFSTKESRATLGHAEATALNTAYLMIMAELESCIGLIEGHPYGDGDRFVLQVVTENWHHRATQFKRKSSRKQTRMAEALYEDMIDALRPYIQREEAC